MNLVAELETRAREILSDSGKSWYIPHILRYRSGQHLPMLEWCEGLYDDVSEAARAAAARAGVDPNNINTSVNRVREEILDGDIITVVEVLPAGNIAQEVLDRIRQTFLSEFSRQ